MSILLLALAWPALTLTLIVAMVRGLLTPFIAIAVAVVAAIAGIVLHLPTVFMTVAGTS